MSMQAQAERERQARVILGDSERQVAEKFGEAAKTYAHDPVALHLRAMNMLYEGLKQNATIVLVPSSALETMQLGGLAGITAMTAALGANGKAKTRPRPVRADLATGTSAVRSIAAQDFCLARQAIASPHREQHAYPYCAQPTRQLALDVLDECARCDRARMWAPFEHIDETRGVRQGARKVNRIRPSCCVVTCWGRMPFARGQPDSAASRVATRFLSGCCFFAVSRAVGSSVSRPISRVRHPPRRSAARRPASFASNLVQAPHETRPPTQRAISRSRSPSRRLSLNEIAASIRIASSIAARTASSGILRAFLRRAGTCSRCTLREAAAARGLKRQREPTTRYRLRRHRTLERRRQRRADGSARCVRSRTLHLRRIREGAQLPHPGGFARSRRSPRRIRPSPARRDRSTRRRGRVQR